LSVARSLCEMISFRIHFDVGADQTAMSAQYHSEMVIVTVLYPKSDESRFDMNYYLEKHIPLVKARCQEWGLESVSLMRGTGTLDGTVPQFEVIGHLAFPSAQHMQDALGAHGQEIIADIPNFTNVQPLIQIDEPL
jgi:uncharacterized protein (TIGR02118 family)